MVYVGISILLQIIPNHSGTSHEWFTNKTDRYVHEALDKVKSSPWSTHDSIKNAWTIDNRTGFENTAYLQQFSGNIADLNFRNDDVVNEFKVQTYICTYLAYNLSFKNY